MHAVEVADREGAGGGDSGMVEAAEHLHRARLSAWLWARPLRETHFAFCAIRTAECDSTDMPDITALTFDDHEWFRRRFAMLDDVREPQDLKAVGAPLAAHPAGQGVSGDPVDVEGYLKRNEP